MLMLSMFMIISLLPMLMFDALCLSSGLYAFLFMNMLIVEQDSVYKAALDRFRLSSLRKTDYWAGLYGLNG
ncbi:hypothetical protein CUU66_20620 [Peribacillus deserti]|uniref:Uncharacterized protein n=1 Tax=Peribacillus deserti TaxID=673318 RepID=A0A2N5M134_9BACI|nr:hypothetical protein CUU66_20620 [Peribacillus deserti]